VLLEREDLLAQLARALDESVASSGRVVLVGGEAGVGKSALVRAAVSATHTPVTIGFGQCDHLAAPAALGPLLEAAPELAELVEQDLDRLTLFRRLVAELGSRPRMLVLEDVHWADEATLDLLRFLGRRVEQHPLMVVATFRDVEVGADHPMAGVLGDLATAAGVRRLHVPPLSPEAVRRLAEEVGSALDVAQLHERTGGNAFYVTEVLAAGEDTLPATVRDAVLVRASRLTSAGQGVLAASAVLAQPADLALLTRVSGEDASAVDECVVAGLLVGDGVTWGFRHELARLSVEATLTPSDRVRLHAAALAALEDGGGADVHRLVAHAEQSGNAATVRRYAAPAAVRSARLGAHREAAELYRLALRHHPDRDDERAALSSALSYECYLTEQVPEAYDARREAMELARDPRAVGDAERWLSRICWYLGRGEEARAWMDRAVETLESLDEGPELAMAYSNRSQLHMLAFDPAETVVWGTKALRIARRVGDTETEIHALNNMGTALCLGGDYLQGVTMLEQSRDLALAADAHEHVARAYTNLSSASVTTRHLVEAEHYLSAGIDYCVERDLDSWSHYMRAWVPRLAADRGQLERAEHLAVALLAQRGLPPIARIPAAVVAAQVAHRRGEDGRGRLEEATALAQTTREAQRLVPAAAAWAELAWLEGRLGEIEACVDLAWSIAVEHPQAWEVAELAWWLSVGGVRRPVPVDLPTPFALMLAQEWEPAAEAWRDLGVPYWDALALGRAPGLDAAREALAILDRLGAPATRAAIVRDRHAEGLPVPRGPRADTSAGPDDVAGLTPREREVLLLLADGLSDSDIAEALVLSRKTVGHHVSAVLRKLDSPTRSRAVAAAGRRGILQP
jgi:DNA-binding CsgD family transcriptional regulator/tetratricopeptide (TPR) repeat protein